MSRPPGMGSNPGGSTCCSDGGARITLNRLPNPISSSYGSGLPIDVGLVEWWPPFTSQRSHPPARALETCPSCHLGSLPDKSESSTPVPVIRNPARCPSLQMDANINRVPWERGLSQAKDDDSSQKQPGLSMPGPASNRWMGGSRTWKFERSGVPYLLANIWSPASHPSSTF
ncbi:hypothetical protein GE21DRAFT_1305006 [Neurospora crassa]|nr:hypothetical protein GE21DRAFT_1305006 [Neurospora crassa]